MLFIAPPALDRGGIHRLAHLRDTQGYVQAASRGLALFDLPAARTQRDRSEWQQLLHWLGAPAAAAPMVLTDLERKSLAGERELLTMLTSYPDLFRTYADRICSIEWVDPRHESIAWAVLATPPGTDPAACMDAARSVCPEAATLVSAGRISATSKHPTETNIVFMLDTLELYTIKRRMRAAQAKLRQDRSLDDEARRALTVQAAQDSQRQRELQKSIGGVADPFRLIGLEAAGTEQA